MEIGIGFAFFNALTTFRFPKNICVAPFQRYLKTQVLYENTNNTKEAETHQAAYLEFMEWDKKHLQMERQTYNLAKIYSAPFRCACS